MKRSGAASYSWEKNEQEQLMHEDTGTPDTTKHEWRTNQYKETLSTILLLPGLLQLHSTAIGENEIIIKNKLIDKMIQPCGPSPDHPFEKMSKIAKEKILKS